MCLLRLTATRWCVSFDKAPLDVVADVFGRIDDAMITVHAVESRVWVTMDFFTDQAITPLVIADACHELEQHGSDVTMEARRMVDGT